MPPRKVRKPRLIPPSAAVRTRALGLAGAVPSEYAVDERASTGACHGAHDAWFVPATVVTGDDLDIDPEYPPQSFQEFRDDKDRRSLKESGSLCMIRLCTCPQDACVCSSAALSSSTFGSSITAPSLSLITDYLSAFYHGMRVQLLPQHLSLRAWEEPRKRRRASGAAAAQREYQGIHVPGSGALIRVRCRPSPDATCGTQLHVSDVLDAVVDVLSAQSDAHTILCLTAFDLYEEDEDDEEDGNLFTCGRAYGGSGIAAVSFARYAPHVLARTLSSSAAATNDAALTAIQAAAWPSACAHVHPLVLAALHAMPTPESVEEVLCAEWLAAACKTAAHEVGHCIGIDHCVYYACTMQGCAHIAEDVRVPPYLCPVDLRKLLFVTGADALHRYAALEAFCTRAEVRCSPSFAAFAAWVQARVQRVRERREVTDCS